MTQPGHAVADVFWSEWQRRAPRERRSIERARLLAKALEVTDPGRPVLTVVGSKGKGTAATYASAYLAAAGLGVVTVTSPELRGIRDRIRVNGRAISGEDLACLAGRLSASRERLPRYRRSAGYLSPSGLFTIAGVLHARTLDADAIVLEAGMGGASDEVGLFAPTAVGITSIFDEHVGVLGDTPAAIAADKAGVATGDTRAVVSVPQQPDVAEMIAATVAAGTGDLTSTEVIEHGSSGIPRRLLPAGFGRLNAELGCVAAERLIESMAGEHPSGESLSEVLSSVRLPGRLSWHDIPHTSTRLFADSAISRAGIAAALTEVHRRWSDIDHVLVCMPDHKDVDGAITGLAGLAVTFVRLTGGPDQLMFTHPLPTDWEVVPVRDVNREFLVARGRRLVALGTGYFIGRLLDIVDADTDTLFRAP